MIPSAFKTFGCDSEFGGLVALEKVQGEVSQDVSVIRRMIAADALFVFSEMDIEGPVERVFNGPVSADDDGMCAIPISEGPAGA